MGHAHLCFMKGKNHFSNSKIIFLVVNNQYAPLRQIFRVNPPFITVKMGIIIWFHRLPS
jgi:hypothetical protein